MPCCFFIGPVAIHAFAVMFVFIMRVLLMPNDDDGDDDVVVDTGMLVIILTDVVHSVVGIVAFISSLFSCF